MAVVRVRVSAAPRADEQAAHAAAAAAHAQRAAFGTLQQHKADQRHGDDQFGDKQQGLHGQCIRLYVWSRAALRALRGPVFRAIRPDLGSSA